MFLSPVNFLCSEANFYIFCLFSFFFVSVFFFLPSCGLLECFSEFHLVYRECFCISLYVYLFSCLLQPSDTNNITAYWCHHFTISNEAQKPYIPLYSFIYIIVNTFSLHSELHQTRMKQGSQGWCSVTIWRDGAGRSGRMGEHMYIYLWPIHVDVWQKPSQYCKVIILQVK